MKKRRSDDHRNLVFPESRRNGEISTRNCLQHWRNFGKMQISPKMFYTIEHWPSVNLERRSSNDNPASFKKFDYKETWQVEAGQVQQVS